MSLARQLRMIEPSPVDFATATRHCANLHPSLRAGDALHLAICEHLHSSLVSFDVELCRAVRHYGIQVHPLSIGSAEAS
ncbi:MAG: type II toxin-antitoxin system VapC family toxin [Cyanobacteria bacterium K_Offshore_0m_m2_072]|nr:type II toxin-antitoxin system VapC family toxin [Cyanobacteria bacterium K_Offshore_0m_m2_072]